MDIVHIASEYSAFAKVGGLGDMVEGLSKEFTKKNRVEVIIPKYSFIPIKKFKKTKMDSYFFYHTKIDGINITLIDPKNNFFKRPRIYGYKDDEKRFINFCNVAMKYLCYQKKDIDILHLHDWHTSLCALLYKEFFKNKNFKIKKIVLTIHNIKYQGECSFKNLFNISLKDKKYIYKKKFLFFSKINLLHLGIKYSDKIVAVSPTYSKEILSKMGYGLENILLKNKKKITGILNGIDYEIFNPQKDEYIFKNFKKEDSIEKIVEAKEKNKKNLQKILKLKKSEKPLICFIGRLVYQKGLKLIIKAIFETLKLDGQFILLGSSNKKTEKKFLKLKKKFKKNKNPNISINLKFDKKLSHQIYAASDFIIIPSRFEPCGLVQMIAFRYATIPIARKTGGLKDSVFENPKISQNGFIFDKFSKKELSLAMNRAIKTYKDKKNLKKIIKNTISLNYSIKKSSNEYLKLYKELLQ